MSWIFTTLLLLASLHLCTCRMKYECGSKLLENCFCGEKYIAADKATAFVVECIGQGFTNVDMLKVLPEETEELVFTGNNIPILPWNVFGDLNNLTKLRKIDMSNNKIRDIKGKSYHHVPNVELLILNHNELIVSDTDDDNYHHPRVFSNFINLQELHLTNAFADNTDEALANDLHDIFNNSGLTKLYKLHLEQNEIKHFRDPNVFCDLPNLHDLYMGDNYVPALNFNVRCLKKLRFLDLEHNNITRLSQKDLDNLDKLMAPNREIKLVMDISRNPLKCDAVAKNLCTWLQRTNVTLRNRDSLECSFNKYSNKQLVNVLCAHKSYKFSQATTIMLVVLSLVLVSLVAAYVYLTRDVIKKKMAPIIDKVGRKVQYTTIESQDV